MAWPMLKSQDLVPPSRKALGGHALPHLPETRDPLDREEKRNTKRSPTRASQCVNWQLNVLAASKVTKGQLQGSVSLCVKLTRSFADHDRGEKHLGQHNSGKECQKYRSLTKKRDICHMVILVPKREPSPKVVAPIEMSRDCLGSKVRTGNAFG